MNHNIQYTTVDRHTHLEGSLNKEWVKKQILKNNLTPPDQLIKLWQGYTLPFTDFIKAFSFICNLLDGIDAVYNAVIAATQRLPQTPSNIPRGIDMWISPYYLVVEKKILSLNHLWQGIDKGINEAKKNNIHITIIIDAVNHLGIDQGHKVLDLIINDKPNWITGFSTGGLEEIPFKEWAKVFERAKQAGLRIAAHAGENGTATNVCEAILEGGVERIVHGTKAAKHKCILNLLAKKKIPVDICISSNLSLITDINTQTHPISIFLKEGIRCAIGTDDPGIIDCNISKEWSLLKKMGLNDKELNLINLYSKEDAWCFKT